MVKKSFKELLKDHQNALIKAEDIFDKAEGGGIFKDKCYSYILKKGYEYHNLFPGIRDCVKHYFKENKISFWGGKTITSNTLSSQVSCLNHLFPIRYDRVALKDIFIAITGIDIKEILPIPEWLDKTDDERKHYIAFEAISNSDRLNETKNGGKLTRGTNCTSIDALIIAKDKSNTIRIIPIEWKLVEDDSGNKAPTGMTSKSEKKIGSGETRVKRYGELIKNCSKLKGLEICNKEDGFYNSSLFNLPFYELRFII